MFYAHKYMLCCASEFFRSLLLAKVKRSQPCIEDDCNGKVAGKKTCSRILGKLGS